MDARFSFRDLKEKFRSSPLRAHFVNRRSDGGVNFRQRLRLRTVAFEQRGAWFARQGLTLAENERAFVKLDIQSVAGLELGVFAQLAGIMIFPSSLRTAFMAARRPADRRLQSLDFGFNANGLADLSRRKRMQAEESG